MHVVTDKDVGSPHWLWGDRVDDYSQEIERLRLCTSQTTHYHQVQIFTQVSTSTSLIRPLVQMEALIRPLVQMEALIRPLVQMESLVLRAIRY